MSTQGSLHINFDNTASDYSLLLIGENINLVTVEGDTWLDIDGEIVGSDQGFLALGSKAGSRRKVACPDTLGELFESRDQFVLQTSNLGIGPRRSTTRIEYSGVRGTSASPALEATATTLKTTSRRSL
ncbi:hypothetical protein AA313_de0203611 [Arthrobotrys entomopaga]|nr:hypothetical protein AA313_de0203611 [Arthrobotrys entomopaga]